MSARDEHLDLIDAVVYGDVFDCAVTFDEAWRYSLVRVTPDELRERFGEPVLRQIVSERDGLYFLAGRDELVERRATRRERAQRLRRRAQRVARWLQHAPFVRGILLTGSVGADDAAEGADIDMLVIVADRRLALTFAMLAPLSRLVSRRMFCPNYYLSDAHLSLTRRDHYMARELVQAQALAGNAEDLLAANSWVKALLPNAAPRRAAVKPLVGGRLLQRLLELPLRGAAGDRFDRRVRRLVRARLAVHHAHFGNPVPEEVRERFEAGVELRFHGAPLVDRLVERYERRRAEIARLIGRLLGHNASRGVSTKK